MLSLSIDNFNSGKMNDPRPKNLAELVKRFRAVVPPDLTRDAEQVGPKPPRTESISSGLEPYNGPWDADAVSHLLKRAMFGVTKSDLDHFLQSDLDTTVAELLTPLPLPDGPVNDYNGTDNGNVDPDVPYGESWVLNKYNNDYEGFRVLSMKVWNIDKIVKQSRSAHEKLYIFWHNHFVIQTWDVFFGKAIWPYFQLLWESSFGNFKTLTKEITINPGMLLYLNGAFNSKEAPDENYARELQELFCIGKGPSAQFTESDVQAAARVLTGWTLNWDAYNFSGLPLRGNFEPYVHDNDDKVFSSFYGNRVISGRSGPEGARELDDLIDMIFDNTETARFICRKLYRFYVYNYIDQETEDNMIGPMAQILRQNDYDILPVLEALFKSAHFFDMANRGVLIKSPFDAILGMWRMMDVDYNDTELNVKHLNALGVLWQTGSLGQEMNDPPSVSGWPAYYQTPSFDKLWITTQTIGDRTVQIDSFLWWGYWNPSGENLFADVLGFTEKLDNPYDLNDLIAETERLALGHRITDSSREYLKSILLSGQSNESYWTEAWANYIADPGNPTLRGIVETRLKSMYQNMFQLAEFQLM